MDRKPFGCLRLCVAGMEKVPGCVLKNYLRNLEKYSLIEVAFFLNAKGQILQHLSILIASVVMYSITRSAAAISTPPTQLNYELENH